MISVVENRSMGYTSRSNQTNNRPTKWRYTVHLSSGPIYPGTFKAIVMKVAE